MSQHVLLRQWAELMACPREGAWFDKMQLTTVLLETIQWERLGAKCLVLRAALQSGRLGGGTDWLHPTSIQGSPQSEATQMIHCAQYGELIMYRPISLTQHGTLFLPSVMLTSSTHRASVMLPSSNHKYPSHHAWPQIC